MTLLTPLYMQPVTGDPSIEYSALQDRASLLAALFSREGVLDVDAGQLLVTQRAAGANFSVDIAAGRAAITGDDISDQGTYLCTSTAVENRATPQPPASGSRTHRVVARVRDKLHNGAWTVYDWVLEILTDTGTGLPAVPPSAIHLATVTMPAGMVSVTDADIVNDPPRARVGTTDRTGSISPLSGWSAPDANRPPRWHLSPSGWVSLGGWIQRNSGLNFTANAGQLYDFTAAFPAAITPVGYRDMPGITGRGSVQYTLNPSTGRLYFRFQASTLVDAGTWLSLDGTGYKL